MSDRLRELAERRLRLRAHCDVQRGYLRDTVHHIESRLERLDRGIAAVRRFMHKPLLLVAGLGVVAFIGPRRLVHWAGRGAVLFASTQRLLRLVRR